MILYVLRHAKAERESPSGGDAGRPLSPRGEAQSASLAAAFRAARPPVDRRPRVILSSPAVRASRTASVIAAALGLPVRHEDALIVDERVSRAIDLIGAMDPADGPVLVVGHNPQLEGLVHRLAPDDPGLGGPLRTGELVVLDAWLTGDRPQGRVLARLRPPD